MADAQIHTPANDDAIRWVPNHYEPLIARIQFDVRDDCTTLRLLPAAAPIYFVSGSDECAKRCAASPPRIDRVRVRGSAEPILSDAALERTWKLTTPLRVLGGEIMKMDLRLVRPLENLSDHDCDDRRLFQAFVARKELIFDCTVDGTKVSFFFGLGVITSHGE